MLQIKQFTFNPVQENTYILYNQHGDCIIIDPGFYYDYEKEAFLTFLKNNQLTPVLLLNTHCHLDHVFGNKFIASEFKLTLKTHALEEAVLQMAPTAGLMYELPFDNYTGSIDFLNEGDKIKLAEDELEVIHVPGHSPGSICFYNASQSFLIAGDALFKNSIGRTDLPGGNHEDLITNIKEKLFALPKDVLVYSGHGPATTIGEEILHNPFLQ